MNEKIVRNAVRKFIEDNKDTWVSGITHGGSPRDMEVAISRFTPPYSPYHISVHSTSNPINMSIGQSNYITDINESYNIVIELADYIFNLPEDQTTFETMTMDFFIVRDRIIKSLKSVVKSPGYLADDTGTYRYKFTSGEGIFISVVNVEEFVQDNVPVMFSTISFTLYGCNDDGDL